MNEKRKFQRYACNIPVKFSYYEGNPDELDLESAAAIKGKGVIMDISKSGTFIVSNSRVSIDMPINLVFSLDNKKNIKGNIVRTGLIQNNPSEVAQRYAGKKVKGDAYIAVKFDILLENININNS
jgi:hypothetical protein